MLSLASVVGHRRLTALLSQTISRGTLPPTLLFVGPPGVGKYRVGKTIAAALNCLSPVTSLTDIVFDACGTCRSCDRIARDVHVDVLTLMPDDRASIKTDVIRDVLERTGYRPFEGRRRVVIIRGADALEDQAQNALLKSLEEPPPGTVFILTTAAPSMLLPTVRSRCIRLRFGRLSEQQVAEVLARDFDLSPQDIRTAAALADGSVGQALAMGTTDLLVLRESALRLLEQTAKPTASAQRVQAAGVLVTTPARKERTREELALALGLMSSMLRDIELLNSGGDGRRLANPGIADELRGIAPAFRGDRARAAFAVVDRAIDAVRRNAGIKVVGEWLAVQV